MSQIASLPRLDILTATDDNYVPWCGVMLTSLLRFNSDSDVRIYIICDNVSEAGKASLKALGEAVNLIDVGEVDLFNGWIPPLHKGTHLNKTAWARLAICEILPPNVHKILHLDVDTLVLGSLQELYNIDLHDFAAAAVDEYRDGRYLGIDGCYFNSGVLLINVDYFAEYNIKEKCIGFVNDNWSRFQFHDQDALNGTLKGKIKFVHRKFNLTRSGMCKCDIRPPFRSDTNFEEDIEALNTSDVRIVHFTGKDKPWIKYTWRPDPFTLIWRKIYRESLWKNVPLVSKKDSFRDKMTTIFLNVLFKLRLRSCPIKYRIEAFPNTRWHCIKSFFRFDSYR